MIAHASSRHVGYGSAIAVILMLIVLIASFFQLRKSV